MINKSSKIYVAGHNGMVGSAIVENLQANGYRNIVTTERGELDLRNQQEVFNYLDANQPDGVIVAAARVGGIQANNDYPYQFLYDNLMIEANLIGASHRKKVQNLIFLGSSCVYPKMAPQPLKEDYLLTGSLEPTNEWYAVAKIAGIKLCQALNRQYGRNYISLMPTNLYGPRDNFDLKTSHVLPAMIRKFHDAKMDGHRPVSLWGSGTPKREFLHVSDLAEAVRFIIENGGRENNSDRGKETGRSLNSGQGNSADYESRKEDFVDLINVGTGQDLTIRELAALIQKIVGHEGDLEWDSSKPDGTPRKLLDVSRLNNLGWKPTIDLESGVRQTYDWFLSNQDSIRKLDMEKSSAMSSRTLE